MNDLVKHMKEKDTIFIPIKGKVYSCRTVSGYDEYLVSRCGEVVSLKAKTPRLLKGSKNNCGYRRVTLSKDGKMKYFQIHRLVCKAFVENPLGYPHVRHLNDVKDDNFVENLAWGDDSMNMRDMLLNGINDKSKRRINSDKFKLAIESFMESDTKIGEIASDLKVNHCTLRKVFMNVSYKDIDFHSEYSREEVASKYKIFSDLKGENHPSSKLKKDDVLDIKTRLKAGESQSELARDYSVSPSTIYDIVLGRRWGHVKLAEE